MSLTRILCPKCGCPLVYCKCKGGLDMDMSLPELNLSNAAEGRSMSISTIALEAVAEAARADTLHGAFPTIQHAAAVLRREGEEAWAEVWLKPVNRAALRMELLHEAASALRFVRLLDEDGITTDEADAERSERR